jgi:hypothetical protein
MISASCGAVKRDTEYIPKQQRALLPVSDSDSWGEASANGQAEDPLAA